MYHVICDGKDVYSGWAEDVAQELSDFYDNEVQEAVREYIMGRTAEDPGWAASLILDRLYFKRGGEWADFLADMVEEAGMNESPLQLSDRLRVEWRDE